MAGFDLILSIFGLTMVSCPCQGLITSPSDGKTYTILNGATENITWSFNDPSKVNYRAWFFTSSNGVFDGHELGIIIKDGTPTKSNSLFDVEIKKPGTLLLKNVNQTYDGTYRFDVSAPGGAGSRSVVIFIAKKPNVTLNCSSPVMLNEGDNFTCLCNGEGGNPHANVTWFKDGVKFSDVGTQNQTLNLLNVAEADSGIYKCVATSYPHENYTDKKSIQFSVHVKPNVTLNCPSPATLIEGGDFSCLCRGRNDLVNVTWYKDGVKITSVGTEMQTLNLFNVGITARGTYKCVATSFPYTDETFVQVIIYFKPKNTMIRLSSKQGIINRSLTMTCSSGGFPEPIYSIFHNDTKIVSTNDRYTISYMKWKDAGTYKCVATNTFGKDSEYVHLNVTYIPKNQDQHCYR